jgi:hypothetical protein
MPTLQAKVKSCRIKACDGAATTKNYCRLHYIVKWQEKKNKEIGRKEKMLDNYVKAITKKYPDKYLGVIKEDLANDKQFKKTVDELDIDNPDKEDSFEEIEEYVKKIDHEEPEE